MIKPYPLFLSGTVVPWLTVQVKLFTRAGFETTPAQNRARLILSASRGYLLDLVTTGDKSAVDASAQAMIDLICTLPEIA